MINVCDIQVMKPLLAEHGFHFSKAKGQNFLIAPWVPAQIAEDSGVDAELEAYVLAKIEERKAAKKAKDFALADAIRNELLEQGIVLKDTREGVKWERA